MTTSQRTPNEGEILLLDGFEYVLGPGKKQLDDQGKVVVLRSFTRPAATGALAAKHKANFNYKAGGVLLEHELVWCEPEQLRADLKEQAEQLIRGSVANRAWAEGAEAVQSAALAKRTAGAWTLPTRHLLKPPRQLRKDVGEVTVLPSRVETSKTLASAVLAHAHVYDITKEG